MMENSNLVTMQELAEILGMSKQRLHQLLVAGKGPPVYHTGETKVGWLKYLFPLAEAMDWHKKRQAELSPAARKAYRRQVAHYRLELRQHADHVAGVEE